jgi:hypothetical protein
MVLTVGGMLDGWCITPQAWMASEKLKQVGMVTWVLLGIEAGIIISLCAIYVYRCAARTAGTVVMVWRVRVRGALDACRGQDVLQRPPRHSPASCPQGCQQSMRGMMQGVGNASASFGTPGSLPLQAAIYGRCRALQPVLRVPLRPPAGCPGTCKVLPWQVQDFLGCV